MLTPSLEDYLEEAFRCLQQNGTVRAKDLADSLQVSMPSVTKAIRRLSRAGYAVWHSHGDIDLTSRGREFGHYLVSRNRVLREFLVVLNGEGDAAAEAEAEAVEHYLRPETIRRLADLTEFLAHDAHGRQFRAFATGSPAETPSGAPATTSRS